MLAQGGIHNILRLHALSFPTLHIPILLIRISNIDLYIGPTFTIVSSAARKHFDPKASEHSGLSCSLFQSGNIRFRIQHSSSSRIRLARLFHWEFKKKKKHMFPPLGWLKHDVHLIISIQTAVYFCLFCLLSKQSAAASFHAMLCRSFRITYHQSIWCGTGVVMVH